jgi:hypothetical protein
MQFCQSSVSRHVAVGLRWHVGRCVRPIETARPKRMLRFYVSSGSVEFTIAKVVILKWPLCAASERHP